MEKIAMDKPLTSPPLSLGVSLISGMIVCAASLPSLGEGFRVENQVFAEDAEEPKIRSTTIFYEDLVYDYLENPQEITVFDRAANRIILLDPLRKVRTELNFRELETLSEQLRTWALGQPDEFLRFSAKPELEEVFDASTGKLQLQSSWLTYEVDTREPARGEILRLYLEFCDWQCLLNTRLNPGSRPPFPRIQLNRALQRLGRVPQEVHLTVRPKGDTFLGEESSARSEHRVIPHLLESDRNRVAQTDQFIAMFRSLPCGEYQTLMQPSR
jgi:hypothetical protein